MAYEHCALPEDVPGVPDEQPIAYEVTRLDISDQLRRDEAPAPIPGRLPQPPPPEGGLALVIERLAQNPSVDVAKLEKIIELQERILHVQAEAAFNAAFSRMQPEIPEVDEKGEIVVKGTLRSTYATLEDIHAAIKPILKTHGFAIRHRTEWPADKPNIIRIVGILSHEQGHSEESVFEAPADHSDYRTDIQSMGSTVSYGRRYTTLDLLNIATRGQDKDGQKQTAIPKAPGGYDNWLTDMTAVAEEGMLALQAAWRKSKVEYREHVTKYAADTWAAIKVRAQHARPA